MLVLARVRIDPLDDHRAVKLALAVARGQCARYHDRPLPDAAIADPTGCAIENAGALADEYSIEITVSVFHPTPSTISERAPMNSCPQ